MTATTITIRSYLLALILAVTTGLIGLADAADLYVSPGGSGTDCSIAMPCQLDQANDNCSTGDRILFNDGTYNRNGVLLTKCNGITYEGINRHLAIIKNNDQTASQPNDVITINDHDNVSIRRLRIDGTTFSGSGDGSSGVEAHKANNFLIEDNIIENTGSTCFNLSEDTTGGIIRHNLMQECGHTKRVPLGGYGRECLNLGGYVGNGVDTLNAEVYGNTCDGFGWQYYDTKIETDGFEIHHNIFKNARDAGNAFNNHAIVTGRNHHFYKNVVFNMVDPNNCGAVITSSSSNNLIEDNVFYDLQDNAANMFCPASGYALANSVVQNNTLCNTGTGETGSGITYSGNLFNQSQSVCDAAEAAIIAEIPALPGYPDVENPSQPQGLGLGPVTETTIQATWLPSTDDVAVAFYRLERCEGSLCSSFSEVAQITHPTVTRVDPGLNPGTVYRYRVRAEDTSGNLSIFSAEVETSTTSLVSTGISGGSFSGGVFQ